MTASQSRQRLMMSCYMGGLREVPIFIYNVNET